MGILVLYQIGCYGNRPGWVANGERLREGKPNLTICLLLLLTASYYNNMLNVWLFLNIDTTNIRGVIYDIFLKYSERWRSNDVPSPLLLRKSSENGGRTSFGVTATRRRTDKTQMLLI